MALAQAQRDERERRAYRPPVSPEQIAAQRAASEEQEREAERHRQEALRKLAADAQQERETNVASYLRSAGFLLEHCGARLTDFSPDVQGAARAFLAAAPKVKISHRPTFDYPLGELIEIDVEARPHGLIVKGPVGTGKSHLAAAIAADVLVMGRAVRGLHARALARQLWDLDHASSILARLGRDVLVIDDFGREGRVTEGTTSAFHELISTRSGNLETTIITTNLGHEEIAAQYDASLASRLASWTHIVLTGADRRQA